MYLLKGLWFCEDSLKKGVIILVDWNFVKSLAGFRKDIQF